MFHTRSREAKTFGKLWRGEMLNSNAIRVLDRERSDSQLLERKNVNEKLRKVCWWEIVRRRPMAATKDHMISSYDVLIIHGKSSQNQRDLPRDIPLDRVEVLRYDTKGVKVRMKIMQTKIELTLEQTQHGISDEVLVSIKGVEE
ncbi:hypothetical protein Tco_1430845 [Tanacetum coccineum]